MLSERSPIPLRNRPDRPGRITHCSYPVHPSDNKLLASLPRDHFELLAPLLTTVSLGQGVVLAEPGDEFDHVYFPHSGMLSLLAVMRDGKAIETATVGREGLVGGMAGLGLYKSLVRVVVQLPITASKITSSTSGKPQPRATPFAISASTLMRCFCLRRASPPHVTPYILSRHVFAAGCFNPRIALRAFAHSNAGTSR